MGIQVIAEGGGLAEFDGSGSAGTDRVRAMEIPVPVTLAFGDFVFLSVAPYFPSDLASSFRYNNTSASSVGVVDAIDGYEVLRTTTGSTTTWLPQNVNRGWFNANNGWSFLAHYAYLDDYVEGFHTPNLYPGASAPSFRLQSPLEQWAISWHWWHVRGIELGDPLNSYPDNVPTVSDPSGTTGWGSLVPWDGPIAGSSNRSWAYGSDGGAALSFPSGENHMADTVALFHMGGMALDATYPGPPAHTYSAAHNPADPWENPFANANAGSRTIGPPAGTRRIHHAWSLVFVEGGEVPRLDNSSTVDPADLLIQTGYYFGRTTGLATSPTGLVRGVSLAGPLIPAGRRRSPGLGISH